MGGGLVLSLVALRSGRSALVGLGLGWLAGINPWQLCHLTPSALAWGVAATGPLLLAFVSGVALALSCDGICVDI